MSTYSIPISGGRRNEGDIKKNIYRKISPKYMLNLLFLSAFWRKIWWIDSIHFNLLAKFLTPLQLVFQV